MLIDSNTVLFDDVAVTSSAVDSAAVCLNSFAAPGRAEPVPMMCRVSAPFSGGTALTVTMEQSEDGLAWETIDGVSATLEATELVKGADFGFRFLPKSLVKPYMRLIATPQGTFSAGRLFAAVTREDALPFRA